MPLEAGRKLAHFEILDLLGRGGMGEVYRARDSKLGREVAIKVLPDVLARDGERLSRFKREAKVLASLHHPNIASIYGLECSENIHYLVLELVDGETLQERISRGRVSVEEATPIAAKIAEALEEAHEHGIVHRDLKPANIKLTAEGEPKVLDFGLAKAFVEEGRPQDTESSPTITREATRAGVILGTVPYMSPEQARGLSLDRRTDIWAFGCVLYEMLTGRPAFSGDTVTDVLASVIGSEPDWQALPRNLPTSVHRVLRTTLRKDPKSRLRDIGDARLELTAPPTVASEVATAQPKRSLAPAPALLALLGLVALGFALGRLTRSTGSPAVVRLEVGIPLEQRFLQLDRAVALSPDGTALVYATYGPLYWRPLDQPEATPIPGTENARSPFFSPDGAWVGFWAEGELRKIATGGGVPITLGKARKPYGVSWSREDRIVVGQGHSGVLEIPGEGGEPELLVRPDASKGEISIHGPQLLPDGRSLLFTLLKNGQNWNSASVVVQRLDTGERRVLFEGGTDARFLPSGHVLFARRETLFAAPYDPNALSLRGSPIPILEGVSRSDLWESGGSHVATSETGTLAYIPASEPVKRTLVWVDRNGEEEILPVPERFYQHPRLSPDGSRVLVDTIDEMDLWVYELERGTMTRLTAEQTHLHPVWSTDGARAVFDSTQGHALYWKSVDGDDAPELLITDESHLLTAVSMSPDGKALAFERTEDYVSFDIGILSLDGARTVRSFIETPDFRESGPMFSPDGRWLAYVSDETGRDEVYVQPYPGPGRRWLVSNGGGREPLWSPNGRELFYRQEWAMIVVPMRAEPDFSPGTPERLFESIYVSEPISAHPTYDVAKDGKRFLMVKNITPLANIRNPRKLHIVLNWHQELERLVPSGE